jgi:hypothetical protein
MEFGSLVDHDVDLAGDEILHRGPSATVGHELEFRTGDVLEVDAADVGAAAVAGGSLRRGRGVRLEPADQIFQVLCRHGLPGDDELRIGGNQRDRLEIIEHMVRQLIDRAIDHMRAPMTD